MSPQTTHRKDNLKEVFLLFLRLGFTAFGGPAGHISLYHDEVVKRRKWVTDQEFLDLIGASHLIPGPNSTEMVIHLSYLRAGLPGMILGGLAFILPAMSMVLALAWSYVHFGGTPEIEQILYAIKPIVVAIIIKALWFLGKKALKDFWTVATALVVVVANIFGVNNILLLLVTGLSLMIVYNLDRIRSGAKSISAIFSISMISKISTKAEPLNFTTLFLAFLKIGSVLYGGGYVLLAYIREDFVQHLGWLTDQQLIDAIAVGQVTPGPLFTTATFIGFILGGAPGALIATLGIFLPSFILVAITNPFIPRLRESVWLAAFLDGVNAASLGLMAAVTIQLAGAVLIDPLTIFLSISAFLLIVFTKINTSWLVLGAAAIGLLQFYFL